MITESFKKKSKAVGIYVPDDIWQDMLNHKMKYRSMSGQATELMKLGHAVRSKGLCKICANMYKVQPSVSLQDDVQADQYPHAY